MKVYWAEAVAPAAITPPPLTSESPISSGGRKAKRSLTELPAESRTSSVTRIPVMLSVPSLSTSSVPRNAVRVITASCSSRMRTFAQTPGEEAFALDFQLTFGGGGQTAFPLSRASGEPQVSGLVPPVALNEPQKPGVQPPPPEIPPLS